MGLPLHVFPFHEEGAGHLYQVKPDVESIKRPFANAELSAFTLTEDNP